MIMIYLPQKHESELVKADTIFKFYVTNKSVGLLTFSK